jgi:hypothetical protein
VASLRRPNRRCSCAHERMETTARRPRSKDVSGSGSGSSSPNRLGARALARRVRTFRRRLVSRRGRRFGPWRQRRRTCFFCGRARVSRVSLPSSSISNWRAASGSHGWPSGTFWNAASNFCASASILFATSPWCDHCRSSRRREVSIATQPARSAGVSSLGGMAASASASWYSRPRG